MKDQISFVLNRDGMHGAIDYCKRALSAYRSAASFRRGRKRHFCHAMPYRPHFVRSIIELRHFLKATNEE